METSPFKPRRILIANRGEIACRVIRSLRIMGHRSIAIYSTADAQSLHTRLADEAYCVGEAPSAQSYLNVPRILEICKTYNIDGVHPGYGFLSENAAFARACEAAGIVFIGPSADTIDKMGDKVEARKQAKAAGVPLIFGSDTLSSAQEALKIADQVGYPVLLKAKAGGGGKGMRQVTRAEDLADAYARAHSEATKSFSDGSLYLEQCIVKARHIEVQIFGDAQGNVYALGDRECSLQRRHQKVIEEAPAPHLKAETRAKMAEAAIALAKAVNYKGAGTLEFLVDAQEKFYFLEMNTRLQVEHPVTELVFGVDLVAEQVRTAFGEPLSTPFDHLQTRGHAIEVRLYAEDPDNNYAPSPGCVEGLTWPKGPFLRVDEGMLEKDTISLFYDPMLAKIAAWGKTRDQARRRLKAALDTTVIRGLKTNLFFLKDLLAHPAVMEGRVWTTFLADSYVPPAPQPSPEDLALMVAYVHTHSPSRQAQVQSSSAQATNPSAWWLSGRPQ